MKPGRNNLLIAVVALGLLVAAAGRLQAQSPIPVTFNVQLTAIVQGATTYNGPITKYSASTRITTKDILNLAANAYDVSFPSGSKLVLYEGDMWAYVISGPSFYWENLTDDNISAIYLTGFYYITQGQSNADTGQQGWTYTYMADFWIKDLDATEIYVSGFTQDKISLSAENGHGSHKATESLAITGADYATINGIDAVVSGKITGSGKATL